MTDAANDVTELISTLDAPRNVLRFLLRLERETFGNAGWHRQRGSDVPGASCVFDLARWVMVLNMSKSQIIHLRTRLVEDRIITHDPATSEIAWNLNFDEWQIRAWGGARLGAGRPKLPAQQPVIDNLINSVQAVIDNLNMERTRIADLKTKNDSSRQCSPDENLFKSSMLVRSQSGTVAGRSIRLRKSTEEREKKEEKTTADAVGRVADATNVGEPVVTSEIALPATRTPSRKTSTSSAKASREKAAPKYDGEEQRYVRELVQALCDHLKIKGPRNLPNDGARERRAAHWFYANGPQEGAPADIATVIKFYHRKKTSDKVFWSRNFLSLEHLEGPWAEHHGDLDSFTRATDETPRVIHTHNAGTREGRRHAAAGTASDTRAAGAAEGTSTDKEAIVARFQEQTRQRLAAARADRDAALARGEQWDPREYDRQQRERQQQQLRQGL
jgi:hypothetical protein